MVDRPDIGSSKAYPGSSAREMHANSSVTSHSTTFASPWQPELLGVSQYTRLHLPALWTRHLRTHRLRRIVFEKGPVEICEGVFLQVTFDSFKVIELELWHVDECCDNRERSSNCICAVSTISKQ